MARAFIKELRDSAQRRARAEHSTIYVFQTSEGTYKLLNDAEAESYFVPLGPRARFVFKAYPQALGFPI